MLANFKRKELMLVPIVISRLQCGIIGCVWPQDEDIFGAWARCNAPTKLVSTPTSTDEDQATKEESLKTLACHNSTSRSTDSAAAKIKGYKEFCINYWRLNLNDLITADHVSQNAQQVNISLPVSSDVRG